MSAPDLTLAASVLDHIEQWLAECGAPLTKAQAAVFAEGRAQIQGNQRQVTAAEITVRLPGGDVSIARLAAQVAEERIAAWERDREREAR